MVLSEYFLWLKKEWAKVGAILSIYLFVMLIVFVRKYDALLVFEKVAFPENDNLSNVCLMKGLFDFEVFFTEKSY